MVRDQGKGLQQVHGTEGSPNPSVRQQGQKGTQQVIILWATSGKLLLVEFGPFASQHHAHFMTLGSSCVILASFHFCLLLASGTWP